MRIPERRLPTRPTSAVPPPPTPEQLIRTRKAKSPWPVWLIGGGLVLTVARSLASSLHPVNAQQAQVLDAVRQWAFPAGVLVLVLGLMWLIVQVSFEPRGAAPTRILSAAGKAFRPPLGPNQVTLGRVRWKASWKRGRRIRRRAGQISKR